MTSSNLYSIVPMTAGYAQEIVTWKYPEPYHIYNYTHSANYLLNSTNWGESSFAVLTSQGDLAGELCVGFVDGEGTWITLTGTSSDQLRSSNLWIGFGMRPDQTGLGLGEGFVRCCTRFAVQWAQDRYQYAGPYIGLAVYQFNRRAIQVYERVGYIGYHQLVRERHGPALPTQWMRLPIANIMAWG